MVKVYDMVTFGVSEPDAPATPIQDNTPASAMHKAIPELGLQLIEAAPVAVRHTLPPTLRHRDADGFLKQWDK